MSSSFVAQVKAQPWYASIAQAMQLAGVPEADWISVIKTESGGNPNALGDYVNGVPQSFGLFQFNVGSGVSSTTALNPTTAGEVASQWMGKALQPYANTSPTPQQVINALEVAGWNGSNPPTNDANYNKRISDLQQTLAEEAAYSTSNVLGASSALTPSANVTAAGAPYLSGSPTTTTATTPTPASTAAPVGVAGAAVIPQVVYTPNDPNPGDNAVQRYAWSHGLGQAEVAIQNQGINAQNAANAAASVVPNTITAGVKSVTDAIHAGAVKAGMVAVALAVVAGGFALIASSGGSSSAPAPGPAR